MKLLKFIGSIFKGIGRVIYGAYHWFIGRHFHHHLNNGSCATEKEYIKEQYKIGAEQTYNFYLERFKDDRRWIAKRKKFLGKHMPNMNKDIDDCLRAVVLFEEPKKIIKGYLKNRYEHGYVEDEKRNLAIDRGFLRSNRHALNYRLNLFIGDYLCEEGLHEGPIKIIKAYLIILAPMAISDEEYNKQFLLPIEEQKKKPKKGR